MKKFTFFCSLLTLLAVIMQSSSCRSLEAGQLGSTPALPEPQPYEEDASGNSDFGGILLDGAAVTAVSALELPDPGTEKDDLRITSDPAVPVPASPSGDAGGAAAASAREPAATASAVAAAPERNTSVPPAGEARKYIKNSYQAVNHSYVKAVWISYIELYDHLFGKNGKDFRELFGGMLDNCRSIGINTVYVHVRAFGDAYYYSELFPFTKRLSGTAGKRTEYDPLEIMLSEAHKRGMSFHAWTNPMRLGSDSDMASVSQDCPIGRWYAGAEKGRYIVNVNGTWYLNPAYEEVRKLIGDGVREIVSGYDVDGVHIDDYFYPTTDTAFDKDAFAESGMTDLAAFRIKNCSNMVKEIYTAVHECGTAVFGAAPQGNNANNLKMLYADVREWCSGGYVDYFTPQIYYGFESTGVPFAACVDEWSEITAGTKTKLYAGLAVYKAGCEDKWAGSGKYEWQNTDTMLKRQTEYADEHGCGGIALYSYAYLFDSGYATAATKAERDNLAGLLTIG